MFNYNLRKLLFMLMIITFLSTTTVFAKENYQGTPVPEFQGIAWKASISDIQNWASERNAQYVQTIEEYNGAITTLVYNNTYAGEPAEYRFNLYKGEFYQVFIYCEKIPQGNLISTWRKFKELLSQKYGNPSYDFYYFQNPYRAGDGFEIQAIRLNKGTAKTYWQRPIGNGDNIIMSCEISTMPSIEVCYQHVEMREIVSKYYDSQKSKDM